MAYSILIPIFNEEKVLARLIKSLEKYSKDGHEVIIINDGSTDNTSLILNKYEYVRSIHLKKNFGKGYALKVGLILSKNNKIIIWDGDLELNTNDLKKIMHLNKKKNINTIVGYRFEHFRPFYSGISWGNFIFTTFFNLLNMTCYKDVLCCAKSFYKSNIQFRKLNSSKFDIDVELLYYLSKGNQNNSIKQIKLQYSRRTLEQGKKLRISDGWSILKRILLSS